jgi:iron complex transport system substrate-binding protein
MLMKVIYSRLTKLLLLGLCTVVIAEACSNFVSPKAGGIDPATSGCRVVQHIMGETCVPNRPKRIVTLSTDTLGNVLALGVKPIASANEFLKEGEFYPYFPKEKTQELVTLGHPGQPNLERLLWLKPDLIIGWGGYSPAVIYPILSEIAPTVFYNWNDQWRENFNFIAEVLGKKEAAQSSWSHYEKRIQDLRIALGDRYENKKVSFIFTYAGGIGSKVKSTFIGSILNDAGLKRPTLQDALLPEWGVIRFSEEELDKVDGDILFIAKAHDAGFLEQLKKKAIWKKLQAVQQNNVYLVDDAWYAGNMTAADAILDDLERYLVK